MYWPALSVTLTFDTPPFLTIAPCSSRPPPSIEMSWSIEDLFSESISTAPGCASAEPNWYASAPDGSAGIASLPPDYLATLLERLTPTAASWPLSSPGFETAEAT